MTELLREKERECADTMAVLKRKTDQWAHIKAQLSKYKSLRSIFPSDTSFNEPDSMTNESESFEQTQLVGTAPKDSVQPKHDSTMPAEVGKALATPEFIPPDHTQLNYLVDLVEGKQFDQEAEFESEREFESDNERENVTDSFNTRPIFAVTKRKGHKRGCPCCEKVIGFQFSLVYSVFCFSSFKLPDLHKK